MTRNRAFPIVAALLAIAACREASTSVSQETVNSAGRYGLTTVNDTLLPRTIQSRTNYTLEITSDTIVLNGDGTWADGTLYRETNGGVVNTFSNFIGGRFEVSNGVVKFSSNAGTFDANLAGNTLTINGAARAVYKK